MKKLSDMFSLRYGQSLELNGLAKVQPPLGINFVSRSLENNGVTARVLTDAQPGATGELTVALGGSVLATFVQPEPFVCGRDVMILTAKDPHMPIAQKLWWSQCILANRYRYSYGRQANRTLGDLLVPDEAPVWVRDVHVPDDRQIAQLLRAIRGILP